MIIPKATFLRQAYIKYMEDQERRSLNEQTLVLGEMAKSLRNPRSHKLGMIAFTFSTEQYPLLAAGACPKHLAFIEETFINAGYAFSEMRDQNGITFTIDWRSFPHQDRQGASIG